MTYERFCKSVASLARRANMQPITVSHDEYHGRFIAVFPDGVKIIANPVTPGFTVRYGSGHQMMTQTL